jgi:hypothetical protein
MTLEKCCEIIVQQCQSGSLSQSGDHDVVLELHNFTGQLLVRHSCPDTESNARGEGEPYLYPAILRQRASVEPAPWQAQQRPKATSSEQPSGRKRPQRVVMNMCAIVVLASLLMLMIADQSFWLSLQQPQWSTLYASAKATAWNGKDEDTDEQNWAASGTILPQSSVSTGQLAQAGPMVPSCPVCLVTTSCPKCPVVAQACPVCPITTETTATSPLADTKVQTKTIPHLPIDKKWCPFVTDKLCHNSALCRPCQDRFLFIIATGRSASTTLTYMLDALPNVRMSGENDNELLAIRRMHENLHTSKTYNGTSYFAASDGKRHSWGHNHVPAQAFACVSQHQVRTMNPPLLRENDELMLRDPKAVHQIVGFKTVRFLDPKNSEQEERAMVDFVKTHFPCSRIIVNIRSNVSDQAQSAFYKVNPNATMILDSLNRRYENVVQLFGAEQAMLLDSSQWTENVTYFNRVVDWLGFSRECHVTELLEFNTKNDYGDGKTNILVNPKCKYLGRLP